MYYLYIINKKQSGFSLFRENREIFPAKELTYVNRTEDWTVGLALAFTDQPGMATLSALIH